MKKLALIAIILLTPLVRATNAQDRPNILIILADDMGVDAYGGYHIGSEVAITPNLDALAEQGLSFQNTWAYPLCAPTRAAMISGQYGSTTGVLQVPGVLDIGYSTLFEEISAVTNGEYVTGVFGKWHIGPMGDANNPNDQGADYFLGLHDGILRDYFSWTRTENGVVSTSTDYFTTHITDAAIDWVDTQVDPWLLWMAHHSPHTPFHLPPDSLYTRSQTNSDLDNYLAMIESIDHEIGRLLGSLTPVQRENTLVIFAGDNGTPNSVLQGFPNRRGKGSLYEGGVRVPMIVSGYGVSRINESEEALVHVMDIYATVLDIVGPDLEGGILNSFSFKNLLSDAAAESRPYNFVQVAIDAVTGYAIRNDRYKLIEYESGLQEFYDLIADPFEALNLLLGSLSVEEQAVLDELTAEAMIQTFGWSCNDGILNGDEQQSSCEMSTTAEEQPVRLQLDLRQNTPNPFFSSTEIAYHLPPGGANVRLEIFDVRGRQIVSLAEGYRGSGVNVNTWTGVNEFGQPVPSGVYFYRLTSPGYMQTRKLVLVR